jgi:hypothetical protein
MNEFFLVHANEAYIVFIVLCFQIQHDLLPNFSICLNVL